VRSPIETLQNFCPIQPDWLDPDSPQELPAVISDTEAPLTTTLARTTVQVQTTIERKSTTTPEVNSAVQTTARPRQAGCGNGVRESFRKNVTCWSDAFGGVLLRQNCGSMRQEIEKGWVKMRNDAWHVLEECDDGNRFSGDGCSADCFVEDAFVCTTSSVTGRADFCRRNAPGGLLELLAERGFLEGWANIAQVEGRESLPSAAGWMRMSLLSYASNSQTQFAELRNWGSIFRREIDFDGYIHMEDGGLPEFLHVAVFLISGFAVLILK
jgi:cysteine-rich repeat protein